MLIQRFGSSQLPLLSHVISDLLQPKQIDYYSLGLKDNNCKQGVNQIKLFLQLSWPPSPKISSVFAPFHQAGPAYLAELFPTRSYYY